MDTEMKPQDTEGKLPTSMLFGPRILREKFFQLCSPEVRARACTVHESDLLVLRVSQVAWVAFTDQ
jgi:hypothetical protein